VKCLLLNACSLINKFDIFEAIVNVLDAGLKVVLTRSPAIAEGPRDAGVPVEIW